MENNLYYYKVAVDAYEKRQSKTADKKYKKLKINKDNYVQLGRKALNIAESVLDDRSIIIKTSLKKTRGNFGRILADVYYKTTKGWKCLNDYLVDERVAYYI